MLKQLESGKRLIVNQNTLKDCVIEAIILWDY